MRLIVYILLFFVAVHAYGVTERMAASAICVESDETERARSLCNFVHGCSRRVDGVLGCTESPERTLYVVDQKGYKGRKERRGKRLIVVYDGQEEVIPSLSRIYRMLVRRRCREITRGAYSEDFVEFLTVSLVYREVCELHRRHQESGNYDYRAARLQFAKGKYPQLDRLYGAVLSLNYPSLYHLYGMHSELLLRCLQNLNRRQPGVFADMMRAERGIPLSKTLSEMMAPQVTPQKWYQQQVMWQCRRDSDRAYEGSFRERLEACCRFTVVSMDKPDAVMVIGLDGMVQGLLEQKIAVSAVTRCRNKVLQLNQDAPYLMLPSVTALADALQAAEQGDVELFKAKLARSREILAQCQARFDEVQSMLNQADSECHTLGRRYGLQMESFRKERKYREELFPRSF